VLERGPNDRLLGSTGHAPGFDRVNGLQVATTAGMMTDLQRRAGLAHDVG
jgi:hypothetical protein